MRKNIFIVTMAVLAALTSCQKEQEPAGQNTVSDEMQFELSLPETKVAGNAFEEGDQVSLYAVEYADGQPQKLQIGGNLINNEKLTRGGSGIWTATDKLYWGTQPCDFYAVYPYVSNPTSVDAHLISINPDQNSVGDALSLGGFEASDILFAKAENATQSGGKVRLQFHHMMSKCVVNIVKGETFEGVIPDDIIVHIYNTATTAKLNIANGSLQKYGLSDRKTITMKKVSNILHEAVVVPQHIENNTPLIEVTMGGIAYLLETSLSFRPGFVHTINLIVNTSPDQEKIEIEIDPEAGQWN